MIRTVQVVLVVSELCAGAAAFAETPAWVTESNQAAQKLLAVQAKYAPETVSAFGVEKYDADVLDLKPATVTRQEADLDAVVQEYTAELKDVSDPRVREDLEILIRSAQDQRTTLALNDRLMVNYLIKTANLPLRPGAVVPGASAEVAIPFRKDNPKFAQAIDGALEALRKDGTLTKLSVKWFGSDVTRPAK